MAEMPTAQQPVVEAAVPGPLSRTEVVRLAYELLLGREPESENVLQNHANYLDIYDLRNRFMLGSEYQLHDHFHRMADLFYAGGETKVRDDTARFDTILAATPDLEARIQHIIASDTRQVEYTTFHSQRFFDQVRAVVGVRRKFFGAVPRVRVLEVGTSPVTGMYTQVLDDIELCTADLPAEVAADTVALRFGAAMHYYVNLDNEALSERYPTLVAEPFHIILFCEVIEHIRASPKEQIADLLKLLAPGGVLIVSTPNALSALRLFQIAMGRKSDAMYSRINRHHHEHHHIHVREYTLAELRDALESCGAKVLLQTAKNYYFEPRKNFIATKYVSAGEVQIALATR